MSDLETHAINQLKDGFTRSGLSTNEWSVEILSDEVEVTETTFERSGNPTPKTPIIRVSPRNCLDQQVMATLAVNLQEKETTTWTVTTEVAITRETELSASGDIIVGEATASTKTGVSFKIGGSAGSSSENSVAINYSQQVPVKAKHQTKLELKIFSTPVEGKIKGNRKVRVRYQYDLDVPFQPWDDTHTGTAIVVIPFEVDFKSEIITYLPVLTEKAIDCSKQQASLYIPGSEGYDPDTDPLFGIPASRGNEQALAMATVTPQDFIPNPSQSLSRIDQILEAATVADSAETLAEVIDWSGDKYALAENLYAFVNESELADTETAIEAGLFNPYALPNIRILNNLDITTVEALDPEDLRRIESIGDKRANYLSDAGISSITQLASLSNSALSTMKVRNLSKRSLLSVRNQANLLLNSGLKANEAEAVNELGIQYPIQPEAVNEILSLPDELLETRLSSTRLPQTFGVIDVRNALKSLI